MPIITRLQALLLIGSYGSVISWLIVSFARSLKATKLDFLVASREIPKIPAAFSIADSWIWAPALFLSAQVAYTWGWVGLFWFTVPNVGCLILFAYFAERMRRLYPDGFTCSGYMRERYSKRVQNVYVFAHGGLATCSFAVQLLMGGKAISLISGLPFFWTTVILAVIPVGYTLYAGIRGSIASDFIQLSLVLVLGAIMVPWAITQGGGLDMVWKGLNGFSHTYTSLVSGDGWNVFLIFGLSATIGLMSGPFGDQSFWQRAFAIKREDVKPAFLIAPWIFALVPLGMAMLGFLAAGRAMPTDDPSRINLQVITTFLPDWASILFACLLLAGLTSKLDTNLSAISSLAGNDVAQRAGATDDRSSLAYSRWAMVTLVVGGIGIANIPGLRLEYLFLTYGTLRSATLLPTIITLVRKQVSETGMFYGILTSLIIGLPMFGYGVVNKILWLSISGTLFTVLASGAIVFLASMRRR